MLRATLLSTALLAALLSLTSASAQTNTAEGARRRQAEDLSTRGESLAEQDSYASAAQLAPESAPAHHGLCVARYMLDEFAEAAEACGRAGRAAARLVHDTSRR